MNGGQKMNASTAELAIGLLHYPVLNKRGETIGSAVTNLDLHDISRAARTYGVKNYFVATPFEDQLELIEEIAEHWLNGHGASANPARKEALEIVRAVDGLDTMVETMSGPSRQRVLVVATSARQQGTQMSYGALRSHLKMNREPVLLLFGTAHGLAPEIIDRVDAVLPPIGRQADYNHLSVRSAVSIILDRLLGDRDRG